MKNARKSKNKFEENKVKIAAANLHKEDGLEEGKGNEKDADPVKAPVAQADQMIPSVLHANQANQRLLN